MELVAIIAITGWIAAGIQSYRAIHLSRVLAETIRATDEVLATVGAIMESIYRVRLSCPICDWDDVVVRETRDLAVIEGERRITVHNEHAGHQLTGQPKPGYYRGEPLN